MTRKQYFMLLWAISSVAVVVGAIIMRINMDVAFFRPMLIDVLATIFMYGLLIFLGMNFAQKIGVRFLLLETNVNFVKDILKPAIFFGILYAGITLVVNTFIPLTSCDLFTHKTLLAVFYQAFSMLLAVMALDAVFLLFVFLGFALLVKTVINNLSMSIVMPIAIAIVGFVNKFNHNFNYTFYPSMLLGVGVGVELIFCLPTWNTLCAVLLSALVWRKGFETAVLCHVVITLVLYLIAPAVVVALGA